MLHSSPRHTNQQGLHTIVSKTGLDWLQPYATTIDKTGQRPSLHLGFTLPDQAWLDLRHQDGFHRWIYMAAHEAVTMSRWVAETYLTSPIPPVRLTLEEWLAGQPGFVSHAATSKADSCFSNRFPWDLFLKVYEQKMFPTKTTPQVLVAEAAAVGLTPGVIATALCSNAKYYPILGEMLLEVCTPATIITLCVYRYTGERPSRRELAEWVRLAETTSLAEVVRQIASTIPTRLGGPFEFDIRLADLQTLTKI